ncbi:hypothetical protein [Salinispora fenicalii]|uniref:hypothetical protein n=1 Tax=Salinispora fenicalii TaxID=1137263 RepID=UPI0004B1AEA9|nr:hypothetical protein [Salinispora fenicalii]
MDRVVFGRPLRSVVFDVAVSGVVALFAVPSISGEPGGWKATLVGFGMAAVLVFRRTHPYVRRWMAGRGAAAATVGTA